MKIINYNSNVENAVPSPDKIGYGEIAVNYHTRNPMLLIKDTSDNIIGFPSEEFIDNKVSLVNDQILEMNEIVINNKTSVETLTTWAASPMTYEEIVSIFE